MDASPRTASWLLRVAGTVIAATGLLAGGLGALADDTRNEAARASSAGAENVAAAVLGQPAPGAAGAPPATPVPSAPPAPAQPAPAAPPAPPVANPIVVERARHLVGMAGRHDIGVLVVDVNGAVVVDYHANDPFVPASTAKMITAAAALVKLGPEYRYQTRLLAPNRPDANGVLHGDLVLVGSGDPVLASPMFQEARPDRPVTPLSTLADAVQGAGIRHVTGGIIGDSSVFGYEPTAPGWKSGHFAEGSAVRVSGLTVNGGRSLWRGLFGIESAPIGDPSREAADVLQALLGQRGITFGKRGASSTVPMPAREHIGQVTSPPLWQILQYMVQTSDNQIADGVFRTLGAVTGNPTWQGSTDEVHRSLQRIGVNPTGLALTDGSGLSRQNRVTPAMLTQVDAEMTKSANGRVWLDLMAVVGHSGTLRNRLVGTPAQYRVRGKTGTLDDVRALSGVVLSDAGARYRFAVIGNGLDESGIITVRQLQDDLARVLAEDAAVCPTGCR